MSEMSAEKKKEIEKYIIKSYFGGGKNVESWVGGVDIVKGTDDGYVPQLIVEVTYFGGSGDIMIKWNVYDEFDCDSEWENSFALRVCKERTIEKNRCDAVDAMSYAWEAWRERIQGKPIFLKTNDEDLQKDKRIKELEKEVKALRAEKEVMERHIQELESHNVNLAETNAVLRNSKDSYLRMVQTGAGYLKDWKEGTGCPSSSAAKTLLEHYLDENKKLQKKIDELRDDISEPSTVIEHYKRDVEKMVWITRHSFGCQDSDNRRLHDEAKKEIESLKKKALKTSNSVMQKELDQEIDKWQKATGRDAPDQAKSRIEGLENAVRLTDKTLLGELESNIDEWQKATGRISPEEAKQYIDRLKGRLNKIHDCSVDW